MVFVCVGENKIWIYRDWIVMSLEFCNDSFDLKVMLFMKWLLLGGVGFWNVI